MKTSLPFLLAAAVCLAPAALLAQDDHEGPPPGEEEPELMSDSFIEKLDTHLKLSDEQRSRIESAVKDSRPALKTKHAELKELHKKAQAAGKDFKDKMFDLKEKIRSTLTNEQKERFDDMRQHMKQRRRGPRFGPLGPGGIPEQMPPGMGENPPFPPERWHEDPMKGRRPRPGEDEGPERGPRRPGGQGERGGAPD